MKSFAKRVRVLLILAGTGLALATEAQAGAVSQITTLDGQTYKSVTVVRVQPDGLVVSFKPEGGGIGSAKLKFQNLSEALQKQYGFDPQRAKDFETQQARGQAQWLSQQDQWEAQRKQAQAELRTKEQAHFQAREQNDRQVKAQAERQAKAVKAQAERQARAERAQAEFQAGAEQQARAQAQQLDNAVRVALDADKSQPSSSTKIGNTWYNSDGSQSRRIGNTVYHSGSR